MSSSCMLKYDLTKKKAILLFSGGLDSILVAKILKEQKIELLGLTFESCFFSPKEAKKAAKKLKIHLKIVGITKEMIKILKKPKYGFGSQINPCLDCHLLMLKKAKEIMEKEKFDFVATGEVLGERPFSQNKKALEIVEKESSLKGYLLRPLSAKLLKPTIPEIKGLVERKKFFAFSGKRRKRQIELAKKFKIKYYPAPAGGCLLTDPNFAERLKDLMRNYPKFKKNDLELLKVGRHFWEGKIKIIVGRNEKENLKLKKLAKKKDVLIEMINYPGPTTLIRNYGKEEMRKEIFLKAKKLIKNYSRKSKGKRDVKFKLKTIEG